MPFKPPEAPRCPVCNQMVYAAEAKMAGGFTYHKVCFKCCKYDLAKIVNNTECVTLVSIVT